MSYRPGGDNDSKRTTFLKLLLAEVEKTAPTRWRSSEPAAELGAAVPREVLWNDAHCWDTETTGLLSNMVAACRNRWASMRASIGLRDLLIAIKSSKSVSRARIILEKAQQNFWVLRPFSAWIASAISIICFRLERTPGVGATSLGPALASCRGALQSIAAFSGLSNILMLTGSFFMLQIYDRVLPSRSVPTLLGLAIIAIILYAFQGVIDLVRSRMSMRIGRFLDLSLGDQVYRAIVRMPLKARGDGDGLQPLRDLDQVRGFLASGGPSALFDLPWMPLYICICFLFHFWIGATALAGTIALVALALAAEVRTKKPTNEAAELGRSRMALAAAGRRNAEVLHALGMTGRTATIWRGTNCDYLHAHERASDVSNGLGTFSRVLRMMLQSAVLAVGAYLVIRQEATAGIIIASSILTARALAPVELAIAHWKGFVSARQAANRLQQLLALFPETQSPLDLPPPRVCLSVQAVAVAPPSEQKLVVDDVSFELNAGTGLGIIGPSGVGKSSLARALVGIWQPVRGTVRLDGAALEHWLPEALGQHIGYLPQDIELFDGTIAKNISRFEAATSSARAVIAAAQAADVHKLILSLPDGYGTQIGEGGLTLSAGQRQRIALARALYRDPFLIVLDEPSSNLDAEGEAALTQAILGVRARGGIAIVIAHRPSAVNGVNHILFMGEDGLKLFGDKDEVLRKVVRSVGARPKQMPSPVVTSPRAIPQITYNLPRFDDWVAKVDRFDTLRKSQVPAHHPPGIRH
jgi:PrtD family type I secretion system ABC transporter